MKTPVINENLVNKIITTFLNLEFVYLHQNKGTHFYRLPTLPIG